MLDGEIPLCCYYVGLQELLRAKVKVELLNLLAK